MDISKAALPPQGPVYSEKDRKHPSFSAYMAHVTFCQQKMIDAPRFDDWVYQREQEAQRTQWTKHERYEEFREWMVANQGGARPCLPTEDLPKGLIFPQNFMCWLEGVRW